MTQDTRYNGWTNYETWLANLHFDDFFQDDAESALQSALEADPSDYDDARQSACDILANQIESTIQEMIEQEAPKPSLFLQDVINAFLRLIDYHEIARHYIDDIPLYSAGWNMPGYLPDSEPALFIDPAAALEYVKESAVQFLEAAEVEPVNQEIDGWKADKNGEFGATEGDYYYFVQRV